MFGRMNILKASGTRGEEGHGLLRDMRRMVVENHPDDSLRWVVGVNLLEQCDEFDTAVPILDMGKDMAGVEIDAGQDRHSAVTNILVVSPDRRGLSWDRRQVGCRQAKRLHTGLLIDADRVDRIRAPVMNGPLGVNGNIPIDQENILRLAVEFRIAPLQVVADLVRLDVVLIQNSPDGTLASLRQARMSRRFSPRGDKPRQRRNRPRFGRQSMVLRLGAGDADHPGLRLVGNFGLMGTVVGILEPGPTPAAKALSMHL